MKKPPPKKSKTTRKAFGKSGLSIPEVKPKQSAWGKFETLIRRATGRKPHSSSKAKSRKA